MGLILSRPSQHDEPSTSYHITYKTRSGPARRKRRPSSPNSQGIHASRNVATSTTLDISKPTPKPVAEQGEHLTSTQTKGEEIVAPVRPFSHQPTPPPRPSSFYRGQGRLSSFFMRCIGHQNHHPLLPPSTTAFEDEQAREAWAYQQSFLTELSRRDAQQRVRSARFFLGICILLVLVWVWIGNWFLVDKRRKQRKQRRPRKHDQAIQAALIDLVIPPSKTDKVVQVDQPESPWVDVGTSMEQVPPRPSSPALPPVPPNTPTRILSFFPPRRLLLPARSQDEIRARETRPNDFLAFFYVWLNIRRDWLRLRAGRVRRQERRDAAVGPDTGAVNAGSNELAAATGEEENTRSGEANPVDAWVQGEIKGMRTISRCTSERHRVVRQARQKDGRSKKSDAQTQCGGERGDAKDAVASYSKGKGKSKDRRKHFTDGVGVPSTTASRTTTRPSSSSMPRAPSLQATSSQACSHSQPQHGRGASLSLNSKDPLHLWEAGVAQNRHAKAVNSQELAEQEKHSIEPKVRCKGTQLLSIFETRQEEWRALVMDIEGMAEKMDKEFEEQLGVKTSTPKEPQAEVFPGSLMGLECNSFDFDFPCLASTDTDGALGFGGGSVLVKHVHPAHTVQRNESMNTLRVRNMMERNRDRGDPWATWDWRWEGSKEGDID